MPDVRARAVRRGRSVSGRFASVHRAVHFAGVAVFVFCFAAVGQAPHAGPAATPASPAPSPAVYPPRLLDVSGVRQPRVRARAAMIYNPTTHEILWESNGFEQRSIASITKVMTALVFLEPRPDLDGDVVISRRDVRRASTHVSPPRRGGVAVPPAAPGARGVGRNVAARALERVSPWGTARLRRADERHGGRASACAIPRSRSRPGSTAATLSTAYDVSRLIAHATGRPVISTIMRKPREHRLRTSRRRLTVRNTNRLLRGRLLVHGGKTGYIDASGYCLATVVKLPDHDPLCARHYACFGSRPGYTRAVRRSCGVLATSRSSRNGAALAASAVRPAD